MGHKAGLAGEEIDGEEIGKLAGHRDDERAEAGGAGAFPVADEDSVGVEDVVGVRADARAIVEEGAGGKQLGVEEGEAFFLGPFREIFPIRDACGGEDFGDGEVVELGILADVEGGEVEAEHLDFVAHGTDRLFL